MKKLIALLRDWHWLHTWSKWEYTENKAKIGNEYKGWEPCIITYKHRVCRVCGLKEDLEHNITRTRTY